MIFSCNRLMSDIVALDWGHHEQDATRHHWRQLKQLLVDYLKPKDLLYKSDCLNSVTTVPGNRLDRCPTPSAGVHSHLRRP